jgi:hypothetical protein
MRRSISNFVYWWRPNPIVDASTSRPASGDRLTLLDDDSIAERIRPQSDAQAWTEKVLFETEAPGSTGDASKNLTTSPNESIAPARLATRPVLVNENVLNSARKKEFAEKYIRTLRSYIREEPFEAGVLSRADYLVREMMHVNSLAAKTCLEELFLTSVGCGEFDIACGVIEIVGRLDESDVDPQGKVMAIAALAVKYGPLQEAGIRAFENWGSLESAQVLSRIDFGSEWLKHYALRVVQAMRCVK